MTIEQLLAHRSGIGDYLDESQQLDLDAHLLAVPVHQLDTAESYLAVLDGFPQAFEPGTDFAYCNGGYVVLALLAERAAGVPFHDLVRRHVIDRAGLAHTAYLRSDALPGDAALGYLHPEGDAEELRTNVLHLPVVGGGDGGIFTTAADLVRLWQALDEGRVVAPETWAEMRRIRSTDGDRAYGLGFWLEGDAVYLTGSDTGASFVSQHLRGLVHLVRPRQHHEGRLAGGAAPRRAAARHRHLVLLTRGSVLDAAPREVHSPAHANPCVPDCRPGGAAGPPARLLRGRRQTAVPTTRAGATSRPRRRARECARAT